MTKKTEKSEEVVCDIQPVPNKLLEFQKQVSAIKKDSKNPFFNSKYFDINSLIDTIKPVMNELSLRVTQPLLALDNGRTALYTQIWDSSEKVSESSIYLPEGLSPQQIGSAITYLRRYSLVSLLFLEAEDDDGNASSEKTHQTTVRHPVTGKDYKVEMGIIEPTTKGNPPDIKSAFAEMKKAKTMEQVKAVWTANKPLQMNKEFILLKDSMKDEIELTALEKEYKDDRIALAMGLMQTKEELTAEFDRVQNESTWKQVEEAWRKFITLTYKKCCNLLEAEKEVKAGGGIIRK